MNNAEFIDAVRAFIGLDPLSCSVSSAVPVPQTGETRILLRCRKCQCRFLRVKRNVKKGKDAFCSRSCQVSHTHRKKASECPHGTYSRYRRGCRCSMCRRANTQRCLRSRAPAL